MNNIDWYAIVEDAGDDADIEQFVSIPAASRLLLMELATQYYQRYNRSGFAEPVEMYEYLSIAQKALARETNVITPYEKAWAMGTAINTIQMFPGLVGLWPMTVTNSIGSAIDLSGSARHLIQNGITRPLFGSSGVLLSSADSQFFSRTDESDLDIRGNEQHIENNGLTMGCWIKPITDSAQQVIMSKATGGGATTIAYWLQRTAANKLGCYVGNGTTINYVASGPEVTTGEWSFVVARYKPSVSLVVSVNNESTINTTSIISLIMNSSASLNIGTFMNGVSGLFYNGYMKLLFLCSSYVHDDDLSGFYESSRSAL